MSGWCVSDSDLSFFCGKSTQNHGRQNQSTRLPIWRDANRLLVEVETVVLSFPRHHKYTVGSDLRLLAMRVCRLLSRALGALGA